MTEQDLYEQIKRKIKQLSGKSSQAEIGTLFNEFKNIRRPDVLDFLKEIYEKNKYRDAKYGYTRPAEREKIKNNCDFTRRSVVLTLMEYIKGPESSEMKNNIGIFLLDCLDDAEHGVRQPILEAVPKYFSENQIIVCYNKFELPADKKSKIDDSVENKYATIKRGLILALGEKISYVDEERKEKILDFVNKVPEKQGENHPYICSAVAEILGGFGGKKHIEILTKIFDMRQYPAYLSAERAIKKIKEREYEKTEPSEFNKKISSLEEAIKVIQDKIDEYKTQRDKI